MTCTTWTKILDLTLPALANWDFGDAVPDFCTINGYRCAEALCAG
jgi:hypothetical protein